jgi:hypothetical protein
MDKFPLSIANCLGVIVYKYLEGSVKRSLERELNVPERSDCEFNGWRILLMETCENAQTALTEQAYTWLRMKNHEPGGVCNAF